MSAHDPKRDGDDLAQLRTTSSGVRGGRLLAGTVLVVGLVLSAVATRYVQRNVERTAQARFSRQAEEAVQEITKRIEAYIATIRSGAALFAASERVTRAEFRHFVDALDLSQNYPGIQGLGFARRLEGAPEQREAEVQRLLAGYSIYPAPPGGRESAIILLEPQDARNRAALGYDMFSEPIRRRAMERARDTGEPAASGMVRLVQEITADRQAGFNIYVPVYKGADAPTTVAARRDELLGWVYGPFRMGDLIEGIFGGTPPFDLSIHAGASANGDSLLFRSSRRSGEPNGLIAEHRLDVAGEQWTLVLRGAAPAHDANELLLPPMVLIASTLIALLVFGITWSQVQGREAAEEASGRLREGEAERSRLLEAERAARREAEQARQRAAFLADVSTLLASTLSAPDMLEQIARRVIPFAGDGCAIDLWVDGELRREVVVYRDPEVEAFARGVFRGAALTEQFAPISRRVAETGESVVMRALPAESLAAAPPDLKDAARRLLASFVIAPLPSRSGNLGAIMITSEREDRFTAVDQELVSDLGRRVALAIENTQLFANAQEAIRVRNDFLSIASHELRTPLTALQAHLQGLIRVVGRAAEEPLVPAQLATRLETALRQTRRLGKLVNELLDVSRITSGHLQLEREPFDLAELARELAERFHEEADRAGVDIRVRAPAGATGRWDRHRLEQVLTNLLSNALKYGAGEPVELEVETAPATVSVRVHDRGIGIAPDALARIFGRFERASSERHYGGLGLGLFITHEIIVAHGGQITVESAPGAGATFRVVLPRNIGS